jgi:hypothetical protein
MEAQRFAGRSTRAARATQRSANQRGKPIVHGRKALNLRRDKRRIDKLERELDGGRQSRQKLEELDKLQRSVAAIESKAPKAGTPPEKEARVTRNTPITCRTYGPDRELLWSRHGFLFCKQCRELDNERPEHKMKLLKMDTLPQKYQCTAGHKSRAFPTALAPVKSVMKIRERKRREPAPDEDYKMSSMVDVKHDHVDEDLDADLDVKDQQEQQQKDEEMVARFIEQATRQRQQIDAIANNVSQMDDWIDTLQHDNRYKDIEIEALRSIISDLRDQNKNLEESLSSMDKEVAKLKLQVKKNNKVKANSKKASEKAVAAVEAALTWRDRMKQADKHLRNNDNDMEEDVSPRTRTARERGQKFQEVVLSQLCGSMAPDSGYSKMKMQKRIDLVVEGLWYLYDGQFRQSMTTLVKKSLKEERFHPANVLKEMDRKGGVLSYEGVEVLRTVEGAQKHSHDTIIPSTSSLQRCAVMVEAYGESIVGKLKVEHTPHGECVSLDPVEVIAYAYSSFGIEPFAKECRSPLAVSIDTAMLSANHYGSLAGFKIQDPNATNPWDGLPLKKMQSVDTIIPTRLLAAKETKESFKTFQPFFEQTMALGEDDVDVNPLRARGYKPFNLAVDCDMSAAFKGVCKGGNLKNSRFGCHMCAIEKEKLADANPAGLCETFCEELHADDPNWKCYHYPILTKERVAEAQDCWNELKEQYYGEFDRVREQTNMSYDDLYDDYISADSKADPRSIHYETIPLSTERDNFYEKIVDELQLRSLPREVVSTYTFSEARDALFSLMKTEMAAEKLIASIEHGTEVPGALFLIMAAVPCILHAENRMGLKFLTCLLSHGFQHAASGGLYKDMTPAKQREKFIDDVQEAINTSLLGDEVFPTSWVMPTVKDKESDSLNVGTICLDNTKTRKIVDQIDVIIDICIPPDDPQYGIANKEYKECFKYYRDAMSIARKHEDLHNEEILEFQRNADIFFRKWVDLEGYDGMTNYIHLMGSGHLSEYMFQYRNLYKHSQQGWEKFNALLKTFYFRRTQRGGSTGRGKTERSILRPIGRWFLRRLVWMSGTSWETIREFSLQKNAEVDEIEQRNKNDENDGETGEGTVCMNGYMGGESSSGEDEEESDTEE